MFSINAWRKLLTYLAVLGALILLYSLEGNSASLAQANPAYIGEVRTFDPDFVMPNVAGLAFSPVANIFLGLPAGPTAQADVSNFIMITPFEEGVGSVSIAATIADSINIAFDSKAKRLLLFDTAARELIAVKARPTGNLKPDMITRFQAEQYGLQNPQGMTLDPATGRLFILDSATSRIVRIEPGRQHSFDGAAALAAGRISQIDLSQLGLGDLRGLAFNPSDGHLYFLSPVELKLYEVTEAGQLVATRDLSGLDLIFRDPQGLVFAPSGDTTDDPAQLDLYLADSGLGSVSVSPSGKYEIYLPLIIKPSEGTAAPSDQLTAPGAAPEGSTAEQGPGRIIEFSLTRPIEIPASVSAMVVTLVRTIDTSQWSPPSPDPSGIAYLPHRGTLLIGDGEVDEMPQFFTGDSLFEATLSGVLSRTLTSSYSDEPVGVDINPVNKHLFISDDTGTRSVYVVNPGSDGNYDTSDDIITSFRTADFGSSDPEGVAYDPSGSGVLYIVDGVNREIYRVTPGANGIFNGVPPAGDDIVTHFDTMSLGLDDPEGGAFNTANGHLYAVGKPAGTLFEFVLTTGGALVQTQTHSISAANAKKPAGLAIAPSSNPADDPAQRSIYIVARGVDNDSNPNENDGKIYEFLLAQPAGTPTNTPVPPTPTNTPVPPTNTPVPPTPTNTPVPPTNTPGTPTNTPVPPTPTNTPGTPTNTPVPPTNTPVPPTPTNTPTGGTGLTFAAEADAKVLDTSPSTNYGTTTKLDVETPGQQSYIRFNVSGVTGTVQSATLRLFVTNSSSNGPAVHGTNNSWTETTITWSNRPPTTTAVIGNIGTIASNVWVEYNVTALVTGNGIYSFVFMPESTNGTTFTSRQGTATSRPQLVLTLQ